LFSVYYLYFARTLLHKAIADFLTDRELNIIVKKTVKAHEQRLRYFTTWFEPAHQVTYVDDLELLHLRGWIAYLQKSLVIVVNALVMRLYKVTGVRSWLSVTGWNKMLSIDNLKLECYNASMLID